MKKLNEIVANELLFELKSQYGFDYIRDCVVVTYYANYDRQNSLIGKFYGLDTMGEFLLENTTVKAFKYAMKDNKYDGTLFVDIDIVLNI